MVAGQGRVQESARAPEPDSARGVVPLTPREFLEEMVGPTVAAWRADHLNARLAKQAANELNNMVDRMLNHWGGGAAEVYNAGTPAEYRRKLVTDVCPDFQLVWDIADAHKHVELGRPDRSVTRDDQTAPGHSATAKAGMVKASTAASHNLSCDWTTAPDAP